MVRGQVWGLRDSFWTSQATRWASLGKVCIFPEFASQLERRFCPVFCWQLAEGSRRENRAGVLDVFRCLSKSLVLVNMTMREIMFKATCIRKRCRATWCYIDKRCHATWCYIHKSVTPHNVRFTRDVTLDDVTHTHTKDVKLNEVRFRRDVTDVTLHDLTYTQNVALHDARWERERESHCQNLQLSPDCQTGEVNKTPTGRKDHSLQTKNLLWYIYICSLPQVSLLLPYHY